MRGQHVSFVLALILAGCGRSVVGGDGVPYPFPGLQEEPVAAGLFAYEVLESRRVMVAVDPDRRLREGSTEVAFFVTDESGTNDVADRVRVIRGDVRDRATVDRAMADVDVVVHAAAALPL